MLLTFNEMHKFKLWSEDAPQAYVKTERKLDHELFIFDVPEEFGIKEDECLQEVKPIYGLGDSGELWHAEIDGHHRKVLKMVPLASDSGLYVDQDEKNLLGLSALYDDDMLRTDNKEFSEKCKATKHRFHTKVKNNFPIEFTGFNVERLLDGKLAISQNRYLRKLEELPEDADFSAFRSMRMKLGRLANTRPDVLFEIATLAQVTEDHFNPGRREFIKRLNRAVHYAVTNRVPLAIPKLDHSSIRIVGFSDASFANILDLSTHFRYIILLVDKFNNSV